MDPTKSKGPECTLSLYKTIKNVPTRIFPLPSTKKKKKITRKSLAPNQQFQTPKMVSTPSVTDKPVLNTPSPPPLELKSDVIFAH